MNDSKPAPELPELPEMLRQVGKIVDQFAMTSRILLTLNDYLPAGTLQKDPRLYQVRENLLALLGPETGAERAGHGSVSRGYPAAVPSSKG